MKGHIFNLLEDFISEIAGDEKLYAILDQCSFDTSKSFVRTENYPDEMLLELVDHAVATLGITVAQAHFAFGEWLYPKLSKLVPASMTDFSHPAPVLIRLDDIHKVELKKLYPDATPPTFSYISIDNQHAHLVYHSPRRMFDLVAGVLQGMAKHYKVGIDIQLVTPYHGDDDSACFNLRYAKPAPPSH